MSWLKSEVVLALTLVVTVGGVILGAYFFLLSNEAALRVELSGTETRLSIAEKAINNRADAEERFSAEMRAALQVIQNGVADLRVQEAARRK